jgi:hypothetical protein
MAQLASVPKTTLPRRSSRVHIAAAPAAGPSMRIGVRAVMRRA